MFATRIRMPVVLLVAVGVMGLASFSTPARGAPSGSPITTPMGQDVVGPLVPIVGEYSAPKLGAWADAIFPELDVLAGDNPDVIDFVAASADDSILVYARSVATASALVGARLTDLKVSADVQGRVHIVQSRYGRAELRRVMTAVFKDPEYSAVGSGQFFLDPSSDRVVVGFLKQPSDAYRSALYRTYGDAVAIQLVGSKVATQAGPERFKDRYPYWGGAGIAPYGFYYYGQDVADCTSGVAMRPASGNDIVVTAGHCTETSLVYNFTSRDGSGNWTNVIGNTLGYRNTDAQPLTDYADVVAYGVSAAEGRIWTGSKHGTTSAAVKSYVLGTPAPDTPLCISGANSGVICTARVNGGGFYFLNTANTNVVGPFVQTRMTGTCTIPGDSGSPYYNTVTGGVRVYGIHYGAEAPDSGGTCRMYYSRLYDPYRLYNATPILG